MDRDIAIRLDGMLMGAMGHLDGIAHYMKNNLSDEEFKELVRSVGRSMAALCDIGNTLHSAHPDTIPKELRPPAPPVVDPRSQAGN